MITKVEIKTIDIKHCKYDVELLNILTQELQNEQIVAYFLSPNKIVVYVVNSHTEFGISVETSGIFHHPEGIYNQFLRDFPNVLLETIPVGDLAVIIEHNDEDEPDVSDIDLVAMETIYDSLPKDTDIVTDGEIAKINDKTRFELNSAFTEVNENFNTQIESAIKHNENVTQIRGTAQIEDIMKAFDDIENDRPVLKKNVLGDSGYYKTDQEINTEKMKELLTGLSEVGANFETMAEAVKLDVYGNSITVESYGDINVNSQYEIKIDTPEVQLSSVSSDEEYLAKMASIADTVTETIQFKVALISFSEFDNYAAKHNVVGWTLNSPTTLIIKYSEDGVTSEDKIEKFHEMMDNLSPAWVQKESDNVAFYTEFHKVYDRDMVGEFMSRVTKHNNFVRESTAKIRTALLDMERDFESLKNEVNLTIDWDKLTAFATKKERTEHRSRGVLIVWGKEEANVVKISNKFKSEEFYLPIHLLNDDIRENYTYEDDLLYIEDVPDFAFYEVLVNGYVMLIEKTDL